MLIRAGLTRVPYALLCFALACGDSDDRTDSGSPSDFDAAPTQTREAGFGDAAKPNDAGSEPRDTGVPSSDADVASDAETDAAHDAALSASDAALPDDASASDAGTDAGANGDASASDAGADANGGGADASGSDAGLDDAGTDAGQDPPPSDAGTDASSNDSCNASAAPAIGRLGLRAVVSSSSLQGLTDAVQAPGSNDWYLVEQRGRVLVLREGSLLPTPFLDLRSEITLRVGSYEDRGLVSIAFAPDYATSGHVYVSVTPSTGARANVDLLLEYTRSAEDPYQVDTASERTIIELRGSRLDSNFVTINIHNGGRVTFGPDGMLYLAMGDGGGVNCGDVEPNATQDVSSLFGKLLRLDLTRPEPYGAADNPFVEGGDPRVLHYGLRNPFRFSFDRKNGDLYLGDVGQNRYEELDYAPAGASGLNFGWSAYEGNSRDTCASRQLRSGSSHTAPIFVADRGNTATGPFADFQAILGGVVYRGSALPELEGVYLFGDYVGSRLGALYQCGSTTSPVTPVRKACNVNEPNAACLRRLDGGPVFSELRAIVEDHDGELYMVANGNSLLKVVANE